MVEVESEGDEGIPSDSGDLSSEDDAYDDNDGKRKKVGPEDGETSRNLKNTMSFIEQKV